MYNWSIAKKAYIDRYCKDNDLIRKIAETAFNGSIPNQDALADWFASQGNETEAKRWRNQANVNRNQKGTEDA